MRSASRFIVSVVTLALFATQGDAQQSLGDLATLSQATSHRASSYDRTGGNEDNVRSLAPGATHTVLDTEGPGKLTHLWMTLSGFDGHREMLRDVVIRVYWEGSATPSVEVPLGDFFGLGHGDRYTFDSAPVKVGSNELALNCYWPMPFYEHAKVTLTNEGQRSIRRIYYNLDYELGEIPAGQGLFHARYHRVRDLGPQAIESNTHGEENYVLLDTKGEGHYVGCFLFVDSAPGGWWGEGDEMIFIDGEEKPSIVGTGTEDYFNNAWGFHETFSYPYHGVSLLARQPDGWKRTTAYRFHIVDPVHFKRQIRVTLEHGWPEEVTNDYSSVAFWYQREVATGGPTLPNYEENRPRDHRLAAERFAPLHRCGTQLEAQLRAAGHDVKAVTTGHREYFGGGYLTVQLNGKRAELTMPEVKPGIYRVTLTQGAVVANDSARAGLAGEQGQPLATDRETELGDVEVDDSHEVRFWIESDAPLSIDDVRLRKVE